MLLSFILALIPIVWLIIALCVIKMPGYIACPISIALAAGVAIFYKRMAVADTATSALDGILSAIWPILIVIIAALFTYNLMQKTGAMTKIRIMLSGVSMDKRIIALIIGWGFGCFMEGMAGFGTAVAIPAGILIAMGFDPFTTVAALLVVNVTPTPFGSVGVPTVTLSSITDIPELLLSSGTALISVVIMFITPFIMVCIIGKGLKALKGIWHIVLISSLSMVIPYFLIAFFIGPQLPDIISSVVSMVVTVLAVMKRKNKPVPEQYRISESTQKTESISVSEGIRAWFPFILITVMLLITSKLVPFINEPLASVKSSFHIYTGNPDSQTTFTWINTPGVLIFISAVIGGLVQREKLSEILKIFGSVVKNNYKTYITICSVFATAKIMQYSGMTFDVATAMVAATARYFPLLSPVIGALGGFVTGSGTSTSVLFGPMQASAGEALGINPAWLASANSLGAGIGKMLAPSNAAIGAAAAGLSGKENRLIGAVVKYGILFLIIGGLCCFFIRPF